MRVAQKSAKAGYDTLVLEEHTSIGKPVQCAGLVSPKVIEMTDTDSVYQWSQTAQVNPPRSEPLEIWSAEPKAAILDRSKFDREMVEKAVKDGARVELKARVLDTRKKDKRTVTYRKNGKKEIVSADIVIGADGPSSIVRRKAGLNPPKEMLPGIQAIVGVEPDGIQIFLGHDVAPGFFGWEIPHPSGTLIGLATNEGFAFDHLNKLMEKRFVEDNILGYQAGSIPLGNMKESVRDSLMIVGDAACQIKPLSGGGLYTGLRGADYCSEVLIDSLEEGNTSQERLQEYHDLWQKDIGKEISKGIWMRRIFQKFSDKNIDDLIDSLRKEKIKKIIAEKGDIDYPSTVAKAVLKSSPKLLKFAGPLIKNIF